LFGESFLDGKTALYFLVFAQFINSISGSIGYLMNMVGEQKVLRNIILIALMFNIVFNYFLIPIYGINGAAFATMISMIFWNLSSVLYIYRKYKILSIYIPLFKGKYYEKK
jgi:O-antigen/teichoic acid export membrane protein